MRRIFPILALCCGLFGIAGAAMIARDRLAQCKAIPLIADELLPNADLAVVDDVPGMPLAWSRAAGGVELRGRAFGNGEGFDLDQDGRALQLIGIGNYVETPWMQVVPGQSYCFSGHAITDSVKGSPTQLRVSFRWLDVEARSLPLDAITDWQPVALWHNDLVNWSPIRAAFRAPLHAAWLIVRIQPASDDRVYLDAMHVRWTIGAEEQRAADPAGSAAGAAPLQTSVTVAPWPNGSRAALSFSFDWETAMGGLVHSRSDDARGVNPAERGLRMREGVTTTLALFRPYNIRATYYANGYNFLTNNTARRRFMGDPTFSEWADQKHGWPNDDWKSRPWFSVDPYGDTTSDPAWYFGDLTPLLIGAGQDIQSHTFSHLHAGYAITAELRADLAEWRALAAEHGAPPPRSLAFPWSGSNGLSYADWEAIEAAGITSVTRTNWAQRQYMLVNTDDLRCNPVPGHERILACPDFYLHNQATAEQSLRLIDRIIAKEGVIDLWAHTEEVTSPEQIAAWRQVVEYAARQCDDGWLWIAPLAEIAAWRQAVTNIRIAEQPSRAAVQAQTSRDAVLMLRLLITNENQRDMQGVTLRLPFAAQRATIGGVDAGARLATPGLTLNLDMRAGETLEVILWPA